MPAARLLHDGLPARLRADKTVRLFEIQVASQETDAAYLATLERLRTVVTARGAADTPR